MPYTEHFVLEGIRFAAFAFVCGCLLSPRWRPRTCALTAAGVLLGILALQAGLLLAGQDGTLVLTLLPLTAYLPAVAGVHVLSRTGFAQTVPVWSAGAMISLTLFFLQKLLRSAGTLALTVAVSLAAVAFCALVFFFLRRPYRLYVPENRSGWLLMSFPAVMLFLLFSYWADTVTDPVLLLLIFLTALSVIGVMIRALASTASLHRLRQAAQLQLEAQRREYEDLRRKTEQGRQYRHDMRHHLRVLQGLFDRANSAEGLQYIRTLDDQLTELEQQTWCENATVNAVLRSYIGRAREEGCRVTVRAQVPQECPVDEADLCVILANGMENAVNACRDNAEENEKWIRVGVTAHENGNLSVGIENPCTRPVAFGRDGLPKGADGERHGIGLRSVEAVVKKYDGILQCELTQGVFRLRAVLFLSSGGDRPGRKRSARPAACALLTLLLGLVLLNCMPAMAQTLETLPGLGAAVRLVDVRSYRAAWGDTLFRADLPVLVPAHGAGTGAGTGAGDAGADDLNQQMEDYIDRVRETFLWYVAREYQGYVASETGYTVLRDDEALLSLCFYTTVNAGGSGEYSRCFTLDKRTGQVLELSDLFAPGSDYVGAVSADILRQMTGQVEAGQGDYFIPGGIWPEEDCFDSIAADQNFYLDADNRLVILFDEYEVAPGSMGSPRFVIDDRAVAGILAPWLLDLRVE